MLRRQSRRADERDRDFADSDRPPVRLPRDVYVLSTISFLVAIGFGVMVPVLPVFARSFGVSKFMVGMVVSSFAFMRLLTSPACPLLTRLLGERLVLGIGMFVVAASTVFAGLATSFEQLLIMRAIGGIGSAMFTVSAMALLLGTVPDAQRGRASAIYSGGFLLGGMAGPAVGGLLAKVSVTAPFFFYAGTLVIAGAVGLAMLSGRIAVVAQEGPEPVPLRVALRDRRYQAACVTMFAQGWQSVGVRSSLVPVLITEVLGGTASTTGIVFAIAAVVQTIVLGPVGRAVDTAGRRPFLIAAGVITGAAALALPFSPHIWVLTIILCVYGVGSAIHSTAPTATVGDVLGRRRSGAPVAFYSMCSDIGAIAGPLVAGRLADQAGYHWAFAVGAGLLLLGALVSIRIPRRPLTVEVVPADGVVTP